ncbi:exodeoxyribonuclease VII large subunit, partial [Streptomyces sp. BF-3]
MIEAVGLTKRYGAKTAVDDLSFQVRPGAVTGFLGPNGSGKSTTMRMILGLDRPTAGHVTIGGHPYRSLPNAPRQVGALLDAKGVHGGRTARNHLLSLAQLAGIPAARVDEVLGVVGLQDVAKRRSSGFSLGMGQRLGIAAALLGDPQVLLFDEPVNGLDPEGIHWVRNLMKSLAAEGLFALDRKKSLPFLPQLIGLVCGRASAAERDVLENARRRWPAVRFEVRNTAVQGVNAVAQVVQAVEELDAMGEVDVIVVARGGGSVEDLLPFSDEQLIRAVAACRTPVVSAIGHEPDSPLLDLVADLRASTPTDAAKKVVPDVGEELERVQQLRDRALRTVRGLLDREERGLAHALGRPAMERPQRLVDEREAEVDALLGRSRRVLGHLLDRADSELAHTLARVVSLSPAATLERGYAVLQRPDGHVVRSPDEAGAPGEPLRARVSEGEFTVRVEDGDGA